MTDRDAFLALNMIPKLGPVRIRSLLERFGTASAILSASPKALREVPGVGEEVAGAVVHWEKHADIEREVERARATNTTILTIADAGYPAHLRQIHDPPTVLYVRGELLDRDRTAIAIVGTRKPSHYGTSCAKKLSYQLAYAGVTVVSGLARGVDTDAHLAALAAQGRTVAVIGSGLDALYPPENAELAAKIAEAGAVLSEFPMATQADRQTFPMRNRIVSGLSMGVLVVEAGVRSGALITAMQAGEQGRAVYAIPGRMDTPAALGSNRLIQQGAKLVMDARDILDELGLLFADPPNIQRKPTPASLAGAERVVYEALGDEETGLDELVARTGLPTAEASSTLLALEIRKLVRPLPGGRFTKIL
jgi:DNA processing protein